MMTNILISPLVRCMNDTAITEIHRRQAEVHALHAKLQRDCRTYGKTKVASMYRSIGGVANIVGEVGLLLRDPPENGSDFKQSSSKNFKIR